MSRAVAVFAIALLVALPPWIAAPTSILVTSALAGALLLLGHLRPSVLATALGGIAATGAYAVALWSADAAPQPVPAFLFGAALLLALRHADVARTFQDIAVPPAIVRAVFRRWAATVALAAAGVILLVAVVALMAEGAPPVFRPLLAGLGAFLALAGAVAVLRPSGRP